MFTNSSSSDSNSSEISVGSPSPPLVKDNVVYFQPIKKIKICKKSPVKSSSLNCSSSSDEKITGFRIDDILGRVEEPLSDKKSTESHSLSKIVRPWDQFHETNSFKTLFHTTFMNQDSRLSFDYHNHLQIHLRAQAQFFRQLNFDLITSESGSDRSSSTQSECCSPEISNRFNDATESQTKKLNSSKCITNSATPLDALFKMTNKSFDDNQRESGKTDT